MIKGKKIPKRFSSKSRMLHNMAMRGTWDNIEYYCSNCQIWVKDYYGAHIRLESHNKNISRQLHDLNEKRKNQI